MSTQSVLKFSPLLIILSAAVVSAEMESITVGVQHFPPYSIIDENAEVSGLAIPAAKQILDKTGLNYIIRGYPNRRLFLELGTGEIQISVNAKGIPGVDESVLHSKRPFSSVDMRLLSRWGVPFAGKLGDLADRKLLVLEGYGYAGMIHKIREIPGIKLEIASSHEIALQMLQLARADYLLDYRLPISFAQKKLGLPDFPSVRLLQMDTFFMVSKKAPKSERLMQRIDRAMEELNWPSKSVIADQPNITP